MNLPESTKKVIAYKIHAVSSSTENYPPHKILQNQPSNPSSRWSSDTNCHPQFITLKFKPSIVQSITFGKYEKMHVCNVRKFRVYGGMEEEGMLKLYEGELRNDSIPESFALKTTVGGRLFPIQFLKIVPIQTWGSSFNYSIWYVELRGIEEEKVVTPVLDTVAAYRQETGLRLCMKMVRELGLDECFEILQKNVAVSLEHPFISNLYDTVVKRGDFQEAELLIDQAAEKGLLTMFVAGQRATPVWTEIHTDPRGASPGMRGGHQMVLDPASQMMYLLGGWDGARDLADFWQYDLLRKKWILISTDTEQEEGPSARSCHKMIIDSDNQTIFVIGRHVDSMTRSIESVKNDFFMYDILRKCWTQLSSDTFADGGPKALFEHQVALDSLKKTIYVLGGKNSSEKRPSGNADSPSFSSLYAYHIPTHSWRKIHLDQKSSALLRHRKGHCVVFHPGKRLLYVVGGNTDAEPVKDLVAFHVDKETVHMVTSASGRDTMPVGLTQRAALDLELDEIYVYFGLAKRRDDDSVTVPNTIWLFDVANSKWSVCPTKKTSVLTGQAWEPSTRYAHEMVYDPVHKLHYLYGGNPGVPNSGTSKNRLDDFWQMQLVRFNGAHVTRQAKYIIRKQKFRELCTEDALRAVQYLQQEVSDTVDPKDDTEIAEFHNLPALLFCGSHASTTVEGPTSKPFTVQQSRVEVFSKLCQFFPEDITPPRQNLVDLVQP